MVDLIVELCFQFNNQSLWMKNPDEKFSTIKMCFIYTTGLLLIFIIFPNINLFLAIEYSANKGFTTIF